eukprot:gene50443-60971_t
MASNGAMAAIYGNKSSVEKKEELQQNLQKWWCEYADRKNDEDAEPTRHGDAVRLREQALAAQPPRADAGRAACAGRPVTGARRQEGRGGLRRLPDFNKDEFEDTCKRRFFYDASFGASTAGLYDLGPVVCRIKANPRATWRGTEARRGGHAEGSRTLGGPAMRGDRVVGTAGIGAAAALRDRAQRATEPAEERQAARPGAN